MNNDLLFLSKRDDGLGERLRAILSAFTLAQVYDADFKFCWNDKKFNKEGHGIDFVNKIFSKDFIAKYHIEVSGLNKVKNVEHFLETKENGWYFCNQSIPKKRFKSENEFLAYHKKLSKSFHAISFSDSVSFSIKQAYNLSIDSNCIALHLRAGDVVYGALSQNCSSISKSIPFPVALRIIEDAQENGKNVIVFGQDINLLQELSELPNVTAAMDLMPKGMDRTEQAFFDMALMSQCSTIYAGSSGFAIVASLMGDATHVVPLMKYSIKEISDIFDKPYIRSLRSAQRWRARCS